MAVRNSSDGNRIAELRHHASRTALLCASISSASLLCQGAAAAAALVVAQQQAPAENVAVPAFVSLLLAGAVYGASTDVSLRRLVEDSVRPASRE